MSFVCMKSHLGGTEGVSQPHFRCSLRLVIPVIPLVIGWSTQYFCSVVVEEIMSLVDLGFYSASTCRTPEV